ncbi:adenylate kinase 8 [Danio rerio]|uniref:Adenylate kinase 8 n=1 Tax=Danio rerio TaxID=7955 RepID=KAD8_DANRE|nr:adenylate kinase 8 [Danio rerio]Q502L7.1 RecName: Full=Adenylate kinase 8; Short=AK 8; AltName: Full=ATP-AMP transphosphorylase 8 [Danio rerio]AAH95649.1 Zgc:112030 [Danio rerio]|eukprot:NP_001018480.1 adenylate kinase 8 [Danio rerio]
MDSAERPLRIPPEMVIYAEKHDIFHLIQTLVRNLMVDKPDDPIQYLINFLERDNVDVPRIILLGPPASGKKTVAKKLCEHTQAIHITFCDILKDDSDLTRAAQSYYDKKQNVPKDLWIQLIQQRLSKPDCVQRGWVLEAIPKTQDEALCLQEAGITPDHVVMLEAPDVVLIERSSGKRIDPVTGDVYHVTFMWPESEEVAQRLETPRTLMPVQVMSQKLQKYHTEAHALKRTYHNCLKIINADQPHVDVFSQVLNFICTPRHSPSPYTPRILLFGPPGAGRNLQAKLIAQKYGIINICCGELLKAVSADESHMGELIKPYLESEQQVPSSIVLRVLTERLSRMDCTARGWVLHGFPRDVEEAELLHKSNFTPNRVFFLEITDDIAIERLALRAVDPVTGEWYHSVYKPPPGPEVQARLRFNPQHSEAQLLMRLKEYWSQTVRLQAFYPQAVYINADQDPHTVFESLESRLVGQLPKVLSNQQTNEN